MAGYKSEDDVLGAPRTARQWLADLHMELFEPPTGEDLRDLDKVMDHDEFWEWGSGKVDFDKSEKSSWKETVVIWIAVWIVLLLVVVLANL